MCTSNKHGGGGGDNPFDNPALCDQPEVRWGGGGERSGKGLFLTWREEKGGRRGEGEDSAGHRCHLMCRVAWVAGGRDKQLPGRFVYLTVSLSLSLSVCVCVRVRVPRVAGDNWMSVIVGRRQDCKINLSKSAKQSAAEGC